MTITLKDGYTPSVKMSKGVDGYTGSRIFLLTALNEVQQGLELRILDYSGLPKRGNVIDSAYPTVKATTLDAEPVKTGDSGDFVEWKVTVSYETEPRDIIDPEDDPTTAPPVINVDSVTRAIVADKAYGPEDVEGMPTIPVVNIINEPYTNPPIIREVTNSIISISMNLRTFKPNWVKEFTDSTNKSSMTIAGFSVGPEQAKMLKIRFTNSFDNQGRVYYPTTYEIEVTNTDFLSRPLNSSTNMVGDDGNRPIKYSDIGNTGKDKDEFVNEPYMLDFDGFPTLIPEEATNQEYKILFPKKWTPLGIPKNYT